MTEDTNGKQTRTYNSWRAMVQRCRTSSAAGFRNYGGRGVSYCKRWNRFANFLADMGERPEGKTLDRIDVNGDYCPENCKWSTPLEQAANKRPRAPRQAA